MTKVSGKLRHERGKAKAPIAGPARFMAIDPDEGTIRSTGVAGSLDREAP
jgi:hypothetical protein